ncbi:MAG: hypothetical protein PHG91_13400 [Syntrophales bacterium]|nr:hypothetical protein [Syntrophales bacterium]
MSNKVLRRMVFLAAIAFFVIAGAAQAQQMTAEQAIKDWPEAAKGAAEQMISKYGQPEGVTPNMLVWREEAPWKEIIVYREEIPHSFPVEHMDVLEQVIMYKVPVDKYDELAEFDGSVIVERTKGTMAARCDNEAANILALNLANDIVTGKRSVQDARDYYAKAVKTFMEQKKMDPYMEKLQFQQEKDEKKTRDSDKSVENK